MCLRQYPARLECKYIQFLFIYQINFVNIWFIPNFYIFIKKNIMARPKLKEKYKKILILSNFILIPLF